jgi:hypothetical protein
MNLLLALILVGQVAGPEPPTPTATEPIKITAQHLENYDQLLKDVPWIYDDGGDFFFREVRATLPEDQAVLYYDWQENKRKLMWGTVYLYEARYYNGTSDLIGADWRNWPINRWRDKRLPDFDRLSSSELNIYGVKGECYLKPLPANWKRINNLR